MYPCDRVVYDASGINVVNAIVDSLNGNPVLKGAQHTFETKTKEQQEYVKKSDPNTAYERKDVWDSLQNLAHKENEWARNYGVYHGRDDPNTVTDNAARQDIIDRLQRRG